MVPGVLVMTTYKMLLIPHQVRKGLHSLATGTGPDERYSPFGHLPDEYLQVLWGLVTRFIVCFFFFADNYWHVSVCFDLVICPLVGQHEDREL